MMNKYKYEEILIGSDAEFSVTITEEMQDAFRLISGDINPLHHNRDFAVKRGFDDKVVFGILTASFYSRLVGVYLPGQNCLIHSVEVKFMKPLYVGNQIKIYGKVTEKNDTFKVITVKAEINSESGIKVSKATIKVGVLNE